MTVLVRMSEIGVCKTEVPRPPMGALNKIFFVGESLYTSDISNALGNAVQVSDYLCDFCIFVGGRVSVSVRTSVFLRL